MRTDKQIYKIFQAKPQWIFELTGLMSQGECILQAVALKEVEQSTDGAVIPADPQQKLTVVEIQFQDDPTIYNRMAMAMVLLQREHEMQDVQGVILFRYPHVDPDTPPWNQIIHSFQLRTLLEDFERAHPDHPLAAVFKPVMVTSETVLESNAVKYYRKIKNSEVADPLKNTLLEVFVSWLEQRFRNKSKEEIEKMLLGDLPDLRDTQSGKDLIRIGQNEGELENSRKILIRQLERRFGKLDAATKRRIRETESTRKLHSLLDQVVTVDSLEKMQW